MSKFTGRLFRTTIAATLLVTFSGCASYIVDDACAFGVASPHQGEKGGVVIVYQPSTTFPDISDSLPQEAQIVESLPSKSGELPFKVALVAADGAPSLLYQTWLSIGEFGAEEDLPAARSSAVNTLTQVYRCSFDKTSKFTSLDEEVDLLGALRVAASSLSGIQGEKTIFVYSNGIQTSAQPNMSESFPASEDEIISILGQLKSANALPDLSGIQIKWSGLGQLTSDYPALNTQTVNLLKTFWTEMIQMSGGIPPAEYGAVLGSEAHEGAPNSSEVAAQAEVCLFQLDATQGFAFQPDSAEFISVEAAKEGAESIARQIFEADCGSKSLRVTGYTASGTSKENFDANGPDLVLSKTRAEKFASLLRELGLEVTEVIGGGKGPYLDWDMDGNFSEELGKKNRIVTIEEVK